MTHKSIAEAKMTENYYNQLAPYYKLMFPDWEGSVQRQAKALDSVIREFGIKQPGTILDVACGIGTQSIGLALLGYQVTAADLSPAEVEQARLEAARYNVALDLRVADMRQAWETYQAQFDALIACDNAVPHLLDDTEIQAAFQGFYQCVKPGGCCVISVRDYSQFEKSGKRKQIYPRLVHSTEAGQVVLFDVWDFDGEIYEMTTYIVRDTGLSEAQTRVIRGGKYYCVEIPVLEKLFLQAGFRQVTTLRDRYYQPLLAAVK